MSLRIVCGARIEDLAEKLVEELKMERQAKGPFEFLKVAVANPNLGNWLQMKVLGKVPELSAGVELPFLDELLTSRVQANYSGTLEVISGRDYPAIILDALMNRWRKEFVPLRKYVKEDFDPQQGGESDENAPLSIKSQREARKAIQLAERLAGLIDGYEATGELALLSEKKDTNETYRAEQALVETLFGANGTKGLLEENEKISLRQLFEEVSETVPSCDAKLVLFGQTSLTDLQLRQVEWVSRSAPVIWYYPDSPEVVDVLPSWQEAKKKLLKRLKAKLGDRLEVVACGSAMTSETCLKRFQSAMTGSAVEAKNQDASLQIIGAPGIRREVEMVYNAILGAVWERNADGKPVAKNGMSFSDIGVVVSDMPKYRHMIEAVFDGRGQVPYGLVDATTQDYSCYLDGFLALMDIARYGLSRKRLFDVLENPCVQRAMGFSRDVVLAWLELAQDYGAYDGYEEQDSDEQNAAGHFNWEWALRRMRLGLVAQDLKVDPTRDEILPLEANDESEVYRLSEVVETLWRKLDALNHIGEPVICSSDDAEAWKTTWAGRLHAIMDEFLAVDKDDSIEAQVRARIVRTLNSLKVISGPKSYKLPVAVVEHVVAGTECAKGGYLRHGVTIGSLRSLAHVPFKQLFVVGLREGGLPGRTDRSTLDVRNVRPDDERLDVLRPEENRARFMAAVMSARDRLVLSYPNCELGSDAKLYPSSLINDLKDACRGRVVQGAFREFEGYPLVEFAETVQTPEGDVQSAVSGEAVESCFVGLLPTFSERAYVLAGKKTKQSVEAQNPIERQDKLSDPTPKDLAEFVKNPFTAILKRRLGIATEGYRDHCVDDASPLGVPKGPVLWDLEKEMVGGMFEEAFARGQCEANIPSSFLGDLAKSSLLDVADWAQKLGLRGEDLEGDGESDTEAVVCRSYSVGGRDPIDLCPDAVLEPLLIRLSKCSETDAGNVEFTVKVIDVEKKQIDSWQWSMSASDAAKYYKNVATLYEKSLLADSDGARQKDADDLWTPLAASGRFPSFTYGELRDVIKTVDAASDNSPDWNQIAKGLLSKRSNYEIAASSFNGNPVVGRVASQYEREPTGEDLKIMFKLLFSVPMTGHRVVQGNGNGGAE